MNRLLCLLSVTFLVQCATPASAAPRPDEKPNGPAIVGQAKSFNELLDMAKAMVKSIGGDQLYKEFEREALPNLDPQKLPGIDPKRPFGLYGFVNAKLEDCRGVLLIPVPSEKDFIDMLTQHGIETAKAKEPGVFNVSTPADFPIHVSFKVHKEYAYVALGGAEVLAEKAMLEPQDVINVKDKSVLSLSLRLERITPEAKKALHTIVRDQLDNLKEMIDVPEGKDAFHSGQKLVLRYLKLLFDEAKEVALRVDADTKTGELFADITVEALPKSPLADLIAKRQPTTNAFASLAGDDYAQRLFIRAPLFADEAKEAFSKLLDWGGKEAIREAARREPAEVISFIESIFKSLKATVESGEMDLAAAIRGPNKDGFYTAVGAVHCKEGAQLEKAIREVVKIMPERERGYFKFDAGKIGDLVVHEIDLSSEAGDIALKIFGKGQKAYFTFGKDALYASYGPDGMKLLKEAVAARPGPAAVMDSKSDPKKLKDIMSKILPPDDPNGPGLATSWLQSAATGIQVTVEGGEKLKIRMSYNLGTLMFFMMGRSVGAGAAIPAKN